MPHHETVTATGRIEDVFAHRFVIATDTGKLLVDITPKGLEKVTLRRGETITIEGEMKPSELKASKVIVGGQEVDIDKKHGKHGHHGPKHHDHDPGPALSAVREAGYEILGQPRGKPKHFEILARRDGELRELHVELDGEIRKAKPVAPGEEKWADQLA